MGAATYRNRERVELRTAARQHDCWSWAEKCRAPGEGWDGQPLCTQTIYYGDRYVRSTIFPGHDSGYADGGWNWRGDPVPPSPVSSAFCMPCARRWVNLKRALDQLDPWHKREAS